MNYDTMLQAIADDCRQKRLHLGLTLDEVADKAGLHRNTVINFERARTRRMPCVQPIGKFSWETIAFICTALGLPFYMGIKWK